MSALVSWPALGIAVVLVSAVLFALWCSWTAGRLDRMHLRLELAEASLETLLQQRASVAMELATGGIGDPASELLLLEAARHARDSSDVPGAERWVTESDLTAVLMALELPPADANPLLQELVYVARRAGMARRIHNDLAATTRRLHARRRVRWFHLAGRAAQPTMVEFDDSFDLLPGQPPPTGQPAPPDQPPPPPAQGSDR